MKEYHKIDTIFKRDEKGKIQPGVFSTPEFEYLRYNKWVFTEKVDGTNVRVMFGSSLKFGGKTDNAQMPMYLLEKLQTILTYEKMNALFPITDGQTEPRSVCLYGEGYGAKIQKGGGNYNPSGVDFVLFDVRIGNWWLKREDVEEIATKLGIQVVPIIGEGSLEDAVQMTAKGFNSLWGDFLAEGIVLRPATELYGRNGRRVITKIKHRDFL
jgi:ATP-dependent RNA circularization protein (DNA/RNA ligase family)